MALFRPLLIAAVALFLLLASCFPSSSATATHLSSGVDKTKLSQMPISELLTRYGFPPHVFPTAQVLHYTFNSDTGDLRAYLQRPCQIHHADTSFGYEYMIMGRLRSGSITYLSGIYIYHQQTWNYVSSIQTYSPTGSLWFNIGHTTLSYPQSYFTGINTCNRLAISSFPNAFLQQLR